jgi:transposase-like protein
MVPPISAVVRTCRGVGGRTWCGGGCQLHLAFGCRRNAPELNKRCRPHLKPTNKSYRIDETYIKVKGEDKYLYRALDSTGQTIDFLLTAKRDTAAAKHFLRKAIEASGNPMPRVMNVDKNPAYRLRWKR